MPERYRLCAVEDLPDPGSRGFSLSLPHETLEVVLVKRQGEVFAYRNRCPHTGVNLEWQADQFFDLSGRYIQCATHGALFRLEDGFCLRGPCAGEHLQSFKLVADEAGLYLVVDPNVSPGR
jgi:nitrite reductase/ring-hydroxylating ferredoxin subunit